MTDMDIERLVEDFSDNFKVNPRQMPLSRDEKSMIGDIFFSAIMEIRNGGNKETVLSLSERLAGRIIGKDRADFHKEVYAP